MQAIAKKEDILKVYEIGYLLVSSVPKEKVTDIVSDFKKILDKKGAIMLAEGAPELRMLAYTMIKKIGPTNHRFTEGYFGWTKFELASKDIESIKKAFDEHPQVLRSIIMTTVKENTYLGKLSQTITRSEDVAPEMAPEVIATEPAAAEAPELAAAVGAGASVEDIDKSIDEMVK